MFAEVSILDDMDMVTGLLNTQTCDLKGLFIPNSAGGGYYRPLIGLSYLIDRFAWFAQSEIMHFENVLLHLINTLLVYYLGRTLFIRDGRERLFPLVAALLFGLHPLTTESVYWISGRTDLLAGQFVLLAALLVARTVRGASVALLAPAVLLIVVGAMAKETALAFIPGMFLIWWGGKADSFGAPMLDAISGRTAILLTAGASLSVAVAVSTSNFWVVILFAVASLLGCLYLMPHEKSGVWSLWPTLVLGGMGILGIGAFWVMRRVAYSSDLSRIGQTMKLMVADTSYTLQLFLGAVAFYVGKFFVPLPLNAAIREIDPLYSLAGAALLVFCLYLLSRPSLFSGLVLTGFLMIAPALPLAFGTIAWTAYAERYVYLALPFWILAAGCILPEVSERRQKLQAVGTILLLASMALIVIQRGQIWATNIALCRDMVAKSPNFKMVRGLYMSALIQAGRFDEVEEQYRIASRLSSVRYEEQYDLVMASVYMKQGRDADAEQMLLSSLKKSKVLNPDIFQSLANFYDTRSRTAPPLERDKYQKLALSYTQQRYELDKDPHTLYQVAKLHLRFGDQAAGVKALKEVVRMLPANDPDRAAVQKLLSGQEKP
jgi:tetratricopeptide (TPR) repeat protein